MRDRKGREKDQTGGLSADSSKRSVFGLVRRKQNGSHDNVIKFYISHMEKGGSL
jgi:hypothetical protein